MKGKDSRVTVAVCLSVCVLGSALAPPVRGGTSGLGPVCLGPGDGDVTDDGIVELIDVADWSACATGPSGGELPAVCCALDFDGNTTIDLGDFSRFQNVFGQCTPDRFLNRCADDCQDAVLLAGEDLLKFNNAGATLDGRPHTGCVFFEEDQIERDVWGCWASPCSGTVFLSTCGQTDADTKIAVYEGCECPATDQRLLSCNDDALCDVQAITTFEAAIGQRYLIRLGVFPERPGGSGFVNITCGLAACPADGDCFSPNGTPGCSDEDCCETLCASDPVCCDTGWDSICVEEALGFCGGGFAACQPGAGSCADPTGNGTPGCEDLDCCNAVCRMDPFCCGIGDEAGEWDSLCAALEAAVCFTACGEGAGSCFERTCLGGKDDGLPCDNDNDCSTANCVGNGTPGCELESCCAEVCSRDTFCCRADGEWDGTCADQARDLCTPP